MPSTKDPVGLVNPGPGRLSAGVVSATSLTFPGGGGSGDLLAHINDPVDAHMAHAIGIDPIYPPTGEPLLQSAGGVIPGESVLDFIAVAKDLFPEPPDPIGIDTPSPNSGLPNWGTLQTQRTGGWADATDVVFSHYLIPTASTTYTVGGTMFPADHGVLALYYSTDGDYFNSGTTTLVAALWLGSTATAPGGLPSADFDTSLRTGQQPDYVATNVGLDQISLTFRLPYLDDYSPFIGAPYAPYNINFFAYQLATYSINPQTVAAGSSGSWLLVEWKESFATSLAQIQPTNLTALTLVPFNATSATPIGGNFNIGNVATVNRRYVFRDTNSGTAPSGNLWTTTQNGVPTTVFLSGVQFYNGTGLSWDVNLKVNGLFDNSFLTGSLANPNVATGFESTFDPIRVNFSDFGGSFQRVPYYDLRKNTIPGNYSPINSPQIGDIAEYINAALTIVSPTSASPVGGFGTVRGELRDAFNAVVNFNDTAKRYLFNSYPQTGGGTASTDVFETFTDEKYRYVSTFAGGSPAVPILPVGGDDFDSTAVFVANGPDLQVVGHQLVYPHDNFSAASYRPVTQPDYAAVLAGDAASTIRRYIRAVDTGIARNIGKLRIRGLAFSSWDSSVPFTGNEVTDHPGGAIIQVKVPGSTGWLDLGRPLGDPDLLTTDFRGCRTALSGSGTDFTATFNTTAFTANNGSGQFLLFVRISLIKNGTGQTLVYDDITWST